MGFCFVLGPCVRCQQPFTFNPLRVPSVRVDGQREPICAACVATVNPIRLARGLAPIVPLPGAYEPLAADAWPDQDESA